MKLTIRIMQHGKKTRTIVAAVPELQYPQMRALFEAEQTLNSVVGNLRVHIGLTDDDDISEES